MIQNCFKFLCAILLGFIAGQFYLEKYVVESHWVSSTDGLGTMPFVALTQTPMVIKVELKDLRTSVVHARIVLSKGLHFYSEKFPQLSSQDRLELEWETPGAPAILPIVVQAESAGSEMVNVKLFNAQDQVVAERIFQIQIAPQLTPHLVQGLKTDLKTVRTHS